MGARRSFGQSALFGPWVVDSGSSPTPSNDAARTTQVVLEVLCSLLAAPVTAAACTGGGTVASSTDPAAGVSLATATSPVLFAQLQTAAGVQTYGFWDLGVAAPFIEGQILSVSPITRGLTDIHGNWETGRVTLRLRDYQRFLRGLVATGELRNKRLDLYLIDLADLRAGNTPWRIAQAVVREAYGLSDLEFELVCEAFFGASVSEFALGKLIPQRVFGDDFPNLDTPLDPTNPDHKANPTLRDKPVPICYGSLSDESAGALAVGVVPTHFVGMRALGAGAADTWYEFVVCGHAIKHIQSWFAADSPAYTRSKMPDVDGTDFLIPGRPGWQSYFGSATYRDFNGRRYTVIYARGPRGLAAAEGKVPITLNICGIESTGDGTGTMISSLPLQIQHLLSTFVLQNYATGNWPAIPLVNGYSRIKSSTFAAAKTASETRTGGPGYLGAFILGAFGQAQPLRELLRDACLSCDLRLGENRHGQIIASLQTPAAAPVITLTDTLDILKHGFLPNIRFADTYDRVLYRHTRRYVDPVTEQTPAQNALLPPANRPATLDWLSGDLEQSDATTISNLGETKTLDQSYPFVRDGATADDVAEHVLARQLKPIYAPIETDLRLTAAELGEIASVTHFEGLSATGTNAGKFELQRFTITAEMPPPDDAGEVGGPADRIGRLSVTADAQDVTAL